MFFQFKYAARQHVRNEHDQVWTHENHAAEMSAFIKSMANSKMYYLPNNPVRAGWAEKPEDDVYSRAKDDATGQKRLVKLIMW